MTLPRTFKYLIYILLSHHRKGHGIHSPFVYDLVSRVFRNKIDPDVLFSVEQARIKMKSDRRIILVKDLGSGSDIMKTNKRRVSDIARYSSVTGKYGRLLSNMASEFGNPMVLELGTSVGLSTLYMAAGIPDTTICTIEGCPETAEIARQNFVEAGHNNIKILTGSFDEILPELALNSIRPGLVFIDGNHRKAPVMRYFNKIAEISDSKTVVIIDDINYSNEMAEVWTEIKLHKKVTISIDIFRMGILFFREGITHNDYIIRY
jgi:predicted O-methyltransferase YrrM